MTLKKSITICIFFLAVTLAVYSPFLTIGEAAKSEGTELPILLFHQIVQDEPVKYDRQEEVISLGYFEKLISGLKREGYHPVTFNQLIEYTNNAGTLPDKPILLTFDDGYESNITLAKPVLKEYEMQATVFVIGVSVGKDTYKDTNVPIMPHFSWEQAEEAKDVLSVQSHTYDMHEVSLLDQRNFRSGVLKKEDESETDYETAFKKDIEKSKHEIQSNLRTPVTAFAYPYGLYTDKSEAILKESGIQATVTTEPGINYIMRGDPECLFAMKRITVSEEASPDRLLKSLSEQEPPSLLPLFCASWTKMSHAAIPWPCGQFPIYSCTKPAMRYTV